MSLNDLVKDGKVNSKDIKESFKDFRELLEIKQRKYKCKGFIPIVVLDRIVEEVFGEGLCVEDMGGEQE